MNVHGIETVNRALLAPWLQGRSFEDWQAQYEADGYLIFPDVMNEEGIERVRAALAPHLTKKGRNDFEGFASNRVYALLSKSPEVFSDMITHPLALAFAEAELGDSCLISGLLAINLHPGETVQGWHYDDGQIQVPLPRPAYGVSTFWAIDDTTEDNGATEIIPGSHKWGPDEFVVGDAGISNTQQYDMNTEHDPQPRSDAIKATMTAGSLMIAKGTLWHRGGANKSNGNRLIVTPQYCTGWARQLENQIAAVPKEIAATLSKRVRQLVGYNIHAAFMGYVDGVHPDETLKGYPTSR